MAQYLKEEFRTKIIEVVKSEFLKNGYEETSMRRIAELSGMTVGNLYRYFKGKDELLRYFVEPIVMDIRNFVNKNIAPIVNLELKNSFTVAKFFLNKNAKKDLQQGIEAFATFLSDYSHSHHDEFILLIKNIGEVAKFDQSKSTYQWILEIAQSDLKIRMGVEELPESGYIYAKMKTDAFFAQMYRLIIENPSPEIFKDLFIRSCNFYIK